MSSSPSSYVVHKEEKETEKRVGEEREKQIAEDEDDGDLRRAGQQDKRKERKGSG